MVPKIGRSEKQKRDARSIFEVQKEKLDQNYLAEWAEQLGVTAEFEKITSREF